MNEEKFTTESILWIKQHTPKLITFAISRPEHYRFTAGQFSRLGFREGNGFVWRAYSVVSAEYADELEYFAVLIPEGPMSAHFQRMQAGDEILLDKTATGFLLPERFADGRDLVMLSTGSGIAPFLSQIQQPQLWQRFERVVLVHCVSHQSELIFTGQIQAFAKHPLVGEYADRLTYLTVTTRETNPPHLHQRLPELLRNGTLARAAHMDFTPEHTRFMICGNPAMVRDTFKALIDLGFSMHRNRLPGQILMENGF